MTERGVRSSWGRRVTGDELQSAARVRAVQLFSAEDTDDDDDSVWLVEYGVLTHGTGAQQPLPDVNMLNIKVGTAELNTTYQQRFRGAFQRRVYSGRKIEVTIQPPSVAPFCPVDAIYQVGVQRVKAAVALPQTDALDLIATGNTAVLDGQLHLLTQRCAIEYVNGGIVAADAANIEVDSWLQLIDSVAAPIADAAPVATFRMTELGDSRRVAIDNWTGSLWAVLSKTPDRYNPFGAGTTRMFINLYGSKDKLGAGAT